LLAAGIFLNSTLAIFAQDKKKDEPKPPKQDPGEPPPVPTLKPTTSPVTNPASGQIPRVTLIVTEIGIYDPQEESAMEANKWIVDRLTRTPVRVERWIK